MKGPVKSSASHFLLLNDWPIKKFIQIVLGLLTLVWGVIALDNLIIPLPIIRQLIVFVFLTFIPGFVILRCMKLHSREPIPTLLYTIGLSLMVLMSTGFFIDGFFALFGLPDPISLLHLLIALSLVIVLLTLVAYYRDTTFSGDISFNLDQTYTPIVLFMLILPFLAIIGTYLVNFYQDTAVLWFLLIAIIALIALAGFGYIPKKYYPLLIFIIALSLLYQTSLISMYLTGSDVHEEYYAASLVIEHAFWDSSIALNINAMLSIVMLCPIYSILLNLDIGWVLKIIYPFLFALLPLGMYQLFREQLGDTFGFLSTMFMISMGTYFTLMLHVLRQGVAEFFLVLLLLVMIDHTMIPWKRRVLGIFFAAGLIVSHYGLAWIYLFIFTLTFLLLLGLNFLEKEKNSNFQFIDAKFLSIYIGMTAIWYGYITASTMKAQLTQQAQTLSEKFYSSFFQVQDSQPAMILEKGIMTPLHVVAKSLNALALILIALGILLAVFWLLTKWKNYEFNLNREFYVLSVTNFITFAAGFVIPSLFMFSTTRIYHIVLIVLSPFTIIGGILLLKIIVLPLAPQWMPSRDTLRKMFTVFFVVLFLFGTSLLYQVANDSPDSIALSQKYISESNSTQSINQFYTTYFLESEVFGVRWLKKHRDENLKVYADMPSNLMPLVSYGQILNGLPLQANDEPPIGSYIYLRYINLRYGLISGPDEFSNVYSISEIKSYLEQRNVIYDNNFTEIR